MSYPESVQYLYALGNELKPGAKFGLERMQLLLEELGSPERGGRFVHVAGTNGKGSVCAAIAAALNESGYRTGLYTSPHLQQPTERIQINGKPVSDDDFAATFEQVHEAAERLLQRGALDAHPSYFETVTAMALLLFRECCDISVMEVGLGGRLDATNVIEPELCVITPISFDHEAYLGHTIESIAREKAGILKAGVPVVVAEQLPEARNIIEAAARHLGARIIDVENFIPSNVQLTPRGCQFDIDGERFHFALAGRHQVGNGVTAILACRELGMNTDAIRRGLETVRWPGRLELIEHAPELILDGAHNPAGAAALAEYIRECSGNQLVWMVYGAMRDKAIDEVISQLFPLAQRLILTAPDMPRALRPEAIAEMTDHTDVTLTRTIADAIATARTAPPETLVFITGSLFVVGEARELILGPMSKMGCS